MSYAEKVFVGTLDDVVARYPWDESKKPYTLEGYLSNQFEPGLLEQLLKDFNSTFQFNALFGREILMNDGYLLNHPASKISILEPNLSPLAALLDAGKVKILRKKVNVGLDETVYDMAGQNNRSYQLLTKMDDWMQYREQLQLISKKSESMLPWPKVDVSQGLDKFFNEFLSNKKDNSTEFLSKKEMKKFEKQFRSIRESTAPRDAWEKAAIKTFGLNKKPIFHLMQIANSYYHFNFSLCLASETYGPVAVESSPNIYTNQYLDVEDSNLFHEDFYEDIKNAFKKIGKLHYFPSSDILLDGEKLVQLYFYSKGSPGLAKQKFLNGLEKFKRGEIGEQVFFDLVYDYSNALQELFSPNSIDRQSKFKIDVNNLSLCLPTRDEIFNGASTGILSTSYLSINEAFATGAIVGLHPAFKRSVLMLSSSYDVKRILSFSQSPIREQSLPLQYAQNKSEFFSNLIFSTSVNNKFAIEHVKNLNRF